MELRGRRVCVTGLGVSGPPVARALLKHGAHVTVVEGRDDDVNRERARTLRELGATVELGEPTTLPAGTDLVVTSPGWRPDAPVLVAAADAGAEVIGDVELAWRLRPAGQVWLAVTGTNGKTTTVRMLEAMLRADGRRALAVGNVGTPVIDAALADGPDRWDILAVELSSFQLHWSATVQPHAAAIINLAPDHLDWHGGMKPTRPPRPRSTAPAPSASSTPPTLRCASSPKPRRPRCRSSDSAWTCRARRTRTRRGPARRPRFRRQPAHQGHRTRHPGRRHPRAPHNVANALAAAALARSIGVAPEAVRTGLRNFQPEPHRIAHVATIDGVDYVDDSKATNAHAAAASLAAYPSVVWIAGGLLKGADVTGLVRQAASRLRGVVLLGADRHQLREALDTHAPHVPVVDVARTDEGAMAEVVAAAARLAQKGDTVLLAPAAASMDMFTNYIERGEAFAREVRALAG